MLTNQVASQAVQPEAPLPEAPAPPSPIKQEQKEASLQALQQLHSPKQASLQALQMVRLPPRPARTTVIAAAALLAPCTGSW